MKIHGKNIQFAMTVGASLEIAKLCPDGDLQRVAEIFGSDNYIKTVEISIKLMKVMNEAYVGIEKLNGRNADALTEEELLLLTPAEMSSATEELLSVFKSDTKGEIEVESKNAKKEAEA